jgi:hypothetical protein
LPGIASAAPYLQTGGIGLQGALIGISALKDMKLKKQLKKQQAIVAAQQGTPDARFMSEAQSAINAQRQSALAQLARGGVSSGGPTGMQAAQLGQVQRASLGAANEARSQAVDVRAQQDAQKMASIEQQRAELRARGAARLSQLASLTGQAGALPGTVADTMKVQDMSAERAKLRAELLKQQQIAELGGVG